MSWEIFFAFAGATMLLILIPGPTVMLAISTSLRHGLRSGLITVSGAGLAVLCQLVVVAVGMVSVLAVLAEWFEWIRWAGVAYLLYLGVCQWLARPRNEANSRSPTRRSRHARFIEGFFVTVTNPKSLAFFAAFFPQFVDPASPIPAQLAVLCATFLVIAVVLTAGYAVLADKARRWFEGAAKQRLRNRLSGSLLIGAAIGLALARR